MAMPGMGVRRSLGKSRAGKSDQQNYGRSRKSGFHKEPPLKRKAFSDDTRRNAFPLTRGTKIRSPSYWLITPVFPRPISKGRLAPGGR